jgi:hypothetical protein
MGATLRQRAGAAVLDLPRLAAALRPAWLSPARSPWVAMRNRAERLAFRGDGARCEWAFASDLHVARVFPWAGRLLLRRALADHPVVFADAPGGGAVERAAGGADAGANAGADASVNAGAPEVSFVIGHRGLERLPLLLATLRSIAGQRGAACECVVVEQSERPECAGALPRWVRHVHTPVADDRAPYSRSAALNAGAAAARGGLLVLHDGDVAAPADYAAELLRLRAAGFDAMNLKRFVFYLSAADTSGVIARGGTGGGETPEAVVENLEGGGSVAVGREAFAAIGGMDEGFAGWGGEDNEFWERCALLRRWDFASLPFLHLWHPPQAGKGRGADSEGQRRYQRLRAVPPRDRVSALLAGRGDAGALSRGGGG